RPGPARILWKWDEYGNNTEVAALGAEGRLVVSPQGLWPFVRRLSGELVLGSGAARMACRYDDRGNLLRATYYGADAEPLAPTPERPYAEVRRAYDEYGNLVETGYYDRHEQLVAVLGKVARITASYSEDGLLKARASYGAGGRLVADPYG